MNKRIIGILGFIGSGKGTIGEYLVAKHGFRKYSFAGSLKDAVSAIFCWPRNLLEGDTPESRDWREKEDKWWSARFNRCVTPRWVLQNLGTDILRNNFFDNIWIASLERKLSEISGNIVITDVRFPNEIKLLQQFDAQLWWVSRGELPTWYRCALTMNEQMKELYPNVHSSEYMWVNQGPFIEIKNDGTIDDLHSFIDKSL
jgi:hypothetical protein